MGEDTTTQFKTEGQPAFPVADNGDGAPAESSPADTTTETTPQSPEGGENSGAGKPDGEDKGFADHPRWKEREEEWKTRYNDQEKRHAEAIQKLREEFAGKNAPAKPATAPDEDVKVPSWWAGDDESYKEYLKDQEAIVERAERKAREKIEMEKQEQQKAIDEATAYMEETIAAIEADKTLNPDGTKIDRNKLLRFVLDNELLDTKGRWNYKAGFLLMRGQSANPAKVEATNDRKKLAAAATSDGKGEAKPSSFATSDTFAERRPW